MMLPTACALRSLALKAMSKIDVKAAVLSAAASVTLFASAAHATVDPGIIKVMSDFEADGSQLATLFLLGYGAISVIKAMRRSV